MKIVVLSGSARTGSVNTKLAAIAARALAELGVEVHLVDPGRLVAPVYNADIERSEGLPVSMSKLKRVISGASGLAVSTPEYNGFVPPLLVNAFAWVSRPEGDEKSCAAFSGKVAAIMAASPGRLGGVRVVPRLRDCLAELGVTVVPGFVTIKSAYGAFEEDGTFVGRRQFARRRRADDQAGCRDRVVCRREGQRRTDGVGEAGAVRAGSARLRAPPTRPSTRCWPATVRRPSVEVAAPGAVPKPKRELANVHQPPHHRDRMG